MFGRSRHSKHSGWGGSALPGADFVGLLLATAFVLLLLMIIAGSHDSSDEPVISSQQAQIDQQPIVEAGAPPVEQAVMSSEDLQLEEGAVSVFSAGSTASPVKVDFDLDGPWDFRRGPEALTLTIENVDKQEAPFEESFPDAAIAVRSSWEPATAGSRYSFQSLDAEAWRAFGDADATGMDVFSGPSRALLFPAAVGDQWTDTYEKVEDDVTTSIVSENSIVAANMLEVPAGEYYAYLLQSRITATGDEESVTTWDYVWLVPGIGRAAEIVSLPGEEEEIFDRAYTFYRLESFSEA